MDAEKLRELEKLKDAVARSQLEFVAHVGEAHDGRQEDGCAECFRLYVLHERVTNDLFKVEQAELAEWLRYRGPNRRKFEDLRDVYGNPFKHPFKP